MNIPTESSKRFSLGRAQFAILVLFVLVVVPVACWLIFWPGTMSPLWYEHVRGPRLRSQFGFTAAFQPVETSVGREYVFAIVSLEPAGILASSGFEVGDILVGYKHGFVNGFYSDLVAISHGARREFHVIRGSDYQRGFNNSRTIVVVRIVGEWTSDPFTSQFGKTTEAFCFGAKGELWRHSETQAGPTGNTGTYRLEGNRVTMFWPSPGSSTEAEVSGSGDRLVLTFARLSRVYRRTASGCENR